MIECECCGLPLCPAKLKGIGYYCPDCFTNCYMEWQDGASAYHATTWRSTITHWRLNHPKSP